MNKHFTNPANHLDHTWLFPFIGLCKNFHLFINHGPKTQDRKKIMKSTICLNAKCPVKILFIMVLCLSYVLTPLSFASNNGKKSFSIVVLPDTQYYSLYYPQIFMSQTTWTRKNSNAMNIVGVVHEGDITHRNSEKEWVRANEALGILDEVVPYYLAIGNHDIGPHGRARNRDTHLFNKYFPISRFEGKPWYGGHFTAKKEGTFYFLKKWWYGLPSKAGNENAFYFLTAGRMRFLLLCLEFGPRNEVLDWANKVVSEHKERRTIVVTHCYLNFDDTRVGKGDESNPHEYGCGGNDGEEIWEKFVRKHENIFLVLSGHILGDGLGRLTSNGDHGNKVHQILANYQMKENGGNGWLRTMKFIPEENRILVRTYSPVLNNYATDDQNHFELDYQMK